MIRVRITKEMRLAALAYEKAVLARLPAHANPTGLESPRRYYYGRLVDLCFEGMCRERYIRARWLGNADGRSDGGIDFEVAAGDTVQVKYTPHNGWRFMENVEERGRQAAVAAYYVAIQPNRQETWATVRGYFTDAQVDIMPIEQGSHGAPYHWRPVSAASPMEDLLPRWVPAVQQAML